ncbi:hypothetical protein ACFQU2_35285 [Siccirubricoccus deserti]
MLDHSTQLCPGMDKPPAASQARDDPDMLRQAWREFHQWHGALLHGGDPSEPRLDPCPEAAAVRMPAIAWRVVVQWQTEIAGHADHQAAAVDAHAP